MIDRAARVLVVVFALGVAACASVPLDDPSRVRFVPVEPRPVEEGTPVITHGAVAARTAAVPREKTEQPHEYRLEPGDQIDVKFYYHPDLNEAFTIRPDGKIALQLIGEVEARGQTPGGLGEMLMKRYTDIGQRNPVAAVILRKAIGQRVYVGGEVFSPKMVGYEGRLTLAQALFEAGGLKPTAERQSVLVLRDAGDGSAVYMTVSVTEEDLRADGDLPLRPYDVVVVPKTLITKVNEFVDQYLSKILPSWVSGNASFAYVTGTTRTRVTGQGVVQ
jgi:polysaccharide export outer membrane protein